MFPQLNKRSHYIASAGEYPMVCLGLVAEMALHVNSSSMIAQGIFLFLGLKSDRPNILPTFRFCSHSDLIPISRYINVFATRKYTLPLYPS